MPLSDTLSQRQNVTGTLYSVIDNNRSVYIDARDMYTINSDMLP